MDRESLVGSDIPARFREIAARRGDAVCICGDDGDWSFAALNRASDGVAVALAELGVRVADRVGLLCINGPEFVVSYLGILKAGATVVPLNSLLNYRELAYILEDSGTCGLFYHQGLETSALSALEMLSERLWRVRIGLGDDPGARRFEDLLAQADVAPGFASGLCDSLAVVLYTSGTTGRPKGAMLTHGNLLANARSVAEALAVVEVDRVLVVLPMFHAFAATVGILTPLLHGCALVPVTRFDPKLVSQSIACHGATIFLGVPSMYGLLLRLADEQVAQWRSVKRCVSGGAAMPVAVMAAFEERFEIPILEGDGPTECGPVTCVNPVNGIRKPGSVGLPIPAVEMRICDPDGAPVPDGVTGEVCVRGPNVMRGYLNQPDATRESFFGDWFRTGDLGYCDEDGYFYLVDRLKDLIITNGMNVYPRVIEEVLYRHPDVAEAAVVGDPDARHGEVPIAHVALRSGAGTASAELRAWCREHLGQHEVPRRLVIHASLPKNAAGKILKRELRRNGEHERGILLSSSNRKTRLSG